MKSGKLVSGLLLGLTLLESPAYAQRDVQRLNTEAIATAITALTLKKNEK
jgi:hypothetical protein